MQVLHIQRPILDHGFKTATLLGIGVTWLAWRYAPATLHIFLKIGVIIYLGLLLPKLVGRTERIRRAIEAKHKEAGKWGFCGRDRDGPWLSYIDVPLIKNFALLKGKYFYSEWLVVHDGIVVVNPGTSQIDISLGEVNYDFSKSRTYAWDGCTPKVSFFWCAYIGTPDWWDKLEDIEYIAGNAVTKRTVFWPMTYHASLVHDALYQYLNVSPVTKAEADQIFYQMLLASGVSRPVAWLYYLFVKYGGARDLVGVNNPNSALKPNFGNVTL